MRYVMRLGNFTLSMVNFYKTQREKEKFTKITLGYTIEDAIGKIQSIIKKINYEKLFRDGVLEVQKIINKENDMETFTASTFNLSDEASQFISDYASFLLKEVFKNNLRVYKNFAVKTIILIAILKWNGSLENYLLEN